MKLNIALVSTTALGLLMAAGVAYAGSNNIGVIYQSDSSNTGSIDQNGDNNRAKFGQTGNGNTAEITQNGNGNEAGRHMAPGLADPTGDTTGYDYIIQNGDDNSLTILQTIGRNQVAGVGGSASTDVIQTGNHNTADITQHGGVSGGGFVGRVVQTDSTGTATHLTNQLTILQQGATPGTYTSPSGGSDYN